MAAAAALRGRRRQFEPWPGYVDVLSTLLMVVIFVLMVFVISQVFLSRALTGRDEALARLNQQILELGDLLSMEHKTTDELRLNLSELSAQLQASTSQRDDLQQRLTVVLGENQSLAASLATAQEQLSQTDAERAELEARMATLRAESDKAFMAAAADKDKIEQQLVDLEKAYQTIEADKSKIQALLGDIAALESLRDDMAKQLLASEDIAADREKLAGNLIEERKISESTRLQLQVLNRQLLALRSQLAALNAALEASEAKAAAQNIQIVDLGQRLNAALAGKVAELAAYRSEFFGRLKEVLGNRPDILIVGDRFVFQSEVLFEVARADISDAGKVQLAQFGRTLIEIGQKIPSDIDWILRVDGHTDPRPINNLEFKSNWELSAARAIAVVQFLIEQGVPPGRLVAAGFGEFRPLDAGQDEIAYRRNRRIELKLDQR
ncbi:MAG: peptidoglycan -binding protein [Dongiaceae bacterium]